jgi:energy-coupling factor transporter ATP-binding protein EcfA2
MTETFTSEVRGDFQALTGTGNPDAFGRLVRSLHDWIDSLPPWPPADAAVQLWREVEPRLAASLEELGRPLVVGLLGGTGTGKSTLVNALAGRDVSEASDVARPTTVRPVVVAAAAADISWFPADEIGAIVVPTDAAAVSEIVLVDCPDPDTQGAEPQAGDRVHDQAAGNTGNRDRLEQILPLCDVLIVVSTAQKYRSFSVASELAAFAPGRPLLFVQTHASRDPDIRDDWKQDLERQGFVVPVIYRIDGRDAFRHHQRGEPTDPAFTELQSAIAVELACREADRIRRNGGLELAGWFLNRCGETFAAQRKPLEDLLRGVDRETQRLEALLLEGLIRQMRQARPGWRQLAVNALQDQWYRGGFGWFLQAVGYVTSWLPRSRRQLSGLVGRTLAGQVPALAAMTHEQPAAEADVLDEALGLDDAEVEQSRSVLAGLARRCGIDPAALSVGRLNPASSTEAVATVLNRAQRWLNSGIRRATASCREGLETTWLRLGLELLFDAVLLAVLARAAWDFFHGRLWLGEARGGLLFEAVVWLTLWGMILRQAALAWATRGLERAIATMSASFEDVQLVQPLLADFAQAASAANMALIRHQHLQAEWTQLTGEAPPSRNLAHFDRVKPAADRA